LANPASGSPDATSGRAKIFIGNKPGQSVVTLSLPDPRFATTSATRTQTVVVAGVRMLSTRDSTLTAINDTAFAIATSLVHANGASVNRASQGIRWVHLGAHTAVVGQGDTVRYIARSNGVDTLIATHDFCLRGAKCADTVVAHVLQQLSMSLSSHLFRSWSFSDSLGPVVTIADRRGTGLTGTTVRFIPLTAADSAVVRVSGVIGTSNPSTGLVASPKLISIGNGGARVLVLGLGLEGTVLGTDTIADTVRQVARRIAVEPLRALLSVVDSIPIRLVARDARGAIIPDATVTIQSVTGIGIHGIWAGPDPANTPSSQANITPQITGIALPDSNPLAPQDPVLTDPAVINLVAADTVLAGATSRQVSVTVLDSLAQTVTGATIDFFTQFGAIPASVVTNSSGVATATWTPPDSAGSYTLTGVRNTGAALSTLADSAGRIVIRRSVVVKASAPSATKTSTAVSPTSIAAGATTTLTVTVRDAFNNVVKTATSADFAVTITGGGTLDAFACTNGVCTATYHAPGAPGAVSIAVKIGGVDVVNSPLALTIT
ncbi:MAG: invasin domain 3-containing protein, partial [Deltaproteobacteria bacterium]